MSAQNQSLKQIRKEARKEYSQLLEFWCMLLGDEGVGKTSLIPTISTQDDQYKALSIKIELHQFKRELIPKKYPKLLPRKQNKGVLIMVRDVRSNPDFKDVRYEFLKFQQAVIVCISLAHETEEKKQTAINNLSSWVQEIRDATDFENIPTILVGTKEDLRDTKEHCISQQEGECLRLKYGFDAYFETSSANPDSVDVMFKGVFDLRCAIVQGTFKKSSVL